MNAMGDNMDNNTNDFKPTKELGDLALYAAGKAFGADEMWDSVKRHTHFDAATIWEIFDGTWTVKSDYIRLLSLCIRWMRPMKVKLRKLPTTLPNRDVMELLENGLEEDLVLYEKTINELCKMPDIVFQTKKSHKRSKNSNSGRRARITFYKGEDFRSSSLYRQISDQNSSFYNNGPCSSDFEYGITDT